MPHGYKMKWHNLGSGRIQLRLCVAILDKAYLCHAYVKNSDPKDKAQAALLLSRIDDIKAGRYGYRGKL